MQDSAAALFFRKADVDNAGAACYNTTAAVGGARSPFRCK